MIQAVFINPKKIQAAGEGSAVWYGASICACSEEEEFKGEGRERKDREAGINGYSIDQFFVNSSRIGENVFKVGCYHNINLRSFLGA